MRYLALLLLTFCALPFSGLAQQAPALHTTRESARVLPLPKGDDMFHFIIYGDRTGGPPEGLRVLSQAVKDTNLLDPDLVMTVGDLLPGYNGPEEWMKDMGDYRKIMDGLKMPWFPVAGNHDIYWRGAPGRPAGEHEQNYEKHFGPLWYWFEHKKCGFLVLYSDENDPARGQKDFTEPANQKFSAAQLEWLRKSLEEMKGLRHVFAFLHHPRWIKTTYPGTDWDDVHKVLTAPGNVRAVFAGHIHRLRYDGLRDGIEYITLATTGGSMPGHYPLAGYVHHMNLVTVRPEGFKAAVLPVGEVMDPKGFTPEFVADIERLKGIKLGVSSPPLAIDSQGLGAGLMEFRIVNPVMRELEISIVPGSESGEWRFLGEHLTMKIPAGETVNLPVTVMRQRIGFDEGFTVPSVVVHAELIGEKARIPLPPRTVTLPVTLKGMAPDFFAAGENKALVLDGKSALRLESSAAPLPDGPFTAEAWVNVPAGANGDMLSKAEQSEYALGLANGVPGFHVFLGGRYVSATGTEAIPADQWVHVAGVFDGSKVTLYVNGKPAASAAGSGTRGTNALPLYVGANPDVMSNPQQMLRGKVDEVRLSCTVRYTAEFSPAARFERDADTRLLLHCDRVLGPFLPSDTETGRSGTLSGKASLGAR